MKYPDLLRTAMLAAATLGAGSVLAQTTAPGDTTPATPVLSTPVVSDARPPPPEDRDSLGAVVLEESPVLALRADPAARMGAGPAIGSIGRRAAHAAARARIEADLERARLDRSLEFQRHGAASLIAN